MNAACAGARPPLLLHGEPPSPRAPLPGVSTSGAAFRAATQPRRRDMPGGPLAARSGLRASQAPIQVAGEQRAPPFTPN
ncbi:hypothetical protein NDU88_006528 [Pleurodeles waltl]|uniref:Uncharacterized protein n=1 Tax=Pleurodeles waltl TaxID=8319 RepID=A0AAV7RSD1_PLEWA|nr:hypothetical protein NDU88_006528 [Pleurodeles waltl]